MTYDLGQAIRLTSDCKDAAGTLANATTVVLTITKPDGTTSAPAVTNPPAVTGKYTVDYTADQAGRHTERWVFTTPAFAYTNVFDVREATSPAIVSLADVKKHLNIAAADTSNDEELRDAIATATDVAEDIVGAVARRTVTEKHSGRGQPAIVLHKTPVISITSVTEHGVALAATDYSLSDEGILTRASAYTAGAWLCGVDNITVVYVAGRIIVTPSIMEGAKELIRVNFRPQQGGNYSPFDQGDSDDYGTRDTGGEVRLGFYIPNRVMQMFKPEALPPGIA